MNKCCFHNAVNRRSFMKIGGLSVAAMFAGGPLLKSVGRADVRNDHRLVLIEMAGGNDGLNTVIPYSNSLYYDLRPRIGIRNGYLPLNIEYALHPSLVGMKRLYDEGQVAIVRGIGHQHPDPSELLSHFFMFGVLRAGHPGGFTQTDQTGWAGRLMDRIASPDAPIVGLTLSTSVSPGMSSPTGRSAAASSTDDGVLPVPEGFEASYRRAQIGMSATDPSDSEILRAAKAGIKGALDLSDFLKNVPESHAEYPDSETARLMAFAARILRATDQIPIIWINAEGIFDTHTGQLGYQGSNLTTLDGALAAFVRELRTVPAPGGTDTLADKVTVAVMSEFGRTGAENDSMGTDHGKANNLFVVGAKVRGGLYGDPPPLDRLDEDGSLAPTDISLLDLPYTLTAAMGADPDAVFPAGSRLIQGLFR